MLNLSKNIFLNEVFRVRLFSTHPSNKIQEHLQEKLVRVAVIGLPNAGKSTLINTVLDRKVRRK